MVDSDMQSGSAVSTADSDLYGMYGAIITVIIVYAGIGKQLLRDLPTFPTSVGAVRDLLAVPLRVKLPLYNMNLYTNLVASDKHFWEGLITPPACGPVGCTASEVLFGRLICMENFPLLKLVRSSESMLQKVWDNLIVDVFDYVASSAGLNLLFDRNVKDNTLDSKGRKSRFRADLTVQWYPFSIQSQVVFRGEEKAHARNDLDALAQLNRHFSLSNKQHSPPVHLGYLTSGMKVRFVAALHGSPAEYVSEFLDAISPTDRYKIIRAVVNLTRIVVSYSHAYGKNGVGGSQTTAHQTDIFTYGDNDDIKRELGMMSNSVVKTISPFDLHESQGFGQLKAIWRAHMALFRQPGQQQLVINAAAPADLCRAENTYTVVLAPRGTPVTTIPDVDHLRLIVKAALSALALLHDVGVVHRDIRVANFIRDNSGCFMLIDYENAWMAGEVPTRDDFTAWNKDVLVGGRYTPAVDLLLVARLFASTYLYDPNLHTTAADCERQLLGAANGGVTAAQVLQHEFLSVATTQGPVKPATEI